MSPSNFRQVRPVKDGRPEAWPVSGPAYHALGELGLIPERTELVLGCIYHKMARSPWHSFLDECLLELLRVRLPPGTYLRTEQPLTGIDSEPEPDIAVVRGAKENYRHAHPTTAELVIEVCATSQDCDQEKVPVYAASRVRECWLVLAPERRIEFWRNPEAGRYLQHLGVGPTGTVVSEAVPGFAVSLDRLFGEPGNLQG